MCQNIFDIGGIADRAELLWVIAHVQKQGFVL